MLLSPSPMKPSQSMLPFLVPTLLLLLPLCLPETFAGAVMPGQDGGWKGLDAEGKNMRRLFGEADPSAASKSGGGGDIDIGAAFREKLLALKAEATGKKAKKAKRWAIKMLRAAKKQGMEKLKETAGQAESKLGKFMKALGMNDGTNLFDRKSGEETGIKQLFDGYGNEAQQQPGQQEPPPEDINVPLPKDEHDFVKAMQKMAGQADDAVEAGADKEPQAGKRLLIEIGQMLAHKTHFLHKLKGKKNKHTRAKVERGVHRLEQAKEKLAQLFKSAAPVPGLAASTDTPEAFIAKTKEMAMKGHELVEKYGGAFGKKGGSIPESEKGHVRSLLLQLEALANGKAQQEQVLDKDGAGHKKAELARHVDRMQKVREALEGMMKGPGGPFEVVNRAPRLSLIEQLQARNRRA